MCERIPGLGFRHRRIPDRAAVFGIHGDQMSVDRPHEQCVAKDRDTAIDATTAGTRVLRRTIGVHPEGPSSDRVERQQIVRRLDGIHDAVHDKRRRLEFFDRPRLEDPLELEVLDVVRRDLCQLAESLALKSSRVGEPVLRLPVGAEEAFERHLRLQRGGR